MRSSIQASAPAMSVLVETGASGKTVTQGHKGGEDRDKREDQQFRRHEPLDPRDIRLGRRKIRFTGRAAMPCKDLHSVGTIDSNPTATKEAIFAQKKGLGR